MKRCRSKVRGSSLVEMVIIMPLILAFILMVWEEYKFMWCRLTSIQAAHGIAWQAVNGSGAPDLTMYRDRITELDAANINLTSFTQSMESPGVGGPVGDILSFFNLFNVNQNGKARGTVAGNINLFEGMLIKGFLNVGNANTADIFSWNFTETVMTDTWASTSEGDIINHVEGGWLGPLGSAGGLAGLVSDVLQFLGIDVPRVNSTAVPPRS